MLTIVLALRLQGRRVRPLRAAAGAALGAAATLLMRGTPAGESPLVWLAAAAAMMLCADPRALRRPLRAAASLLAAAGLLGGTVYALAGAFGSLQAAWLAGTVFALAASRIGLRRPKADGCTLRITAGGRRAEFAAIIDTGNSLRDYLTGLPVIVIPYADAVRQLDPDALRLRPLAARTAGGQQLMWCFVPDEIVLAGNDGRQRVRAAAALSPGLEAGSPALTPAGLSDDNADNGWG